MKPHLILHNSYFIIVMRFFLLACAGCILLGVLLYPRRGPGPGPVALPEVPRAQLTLRDGHFYEAGTNVLEGIFIP